MRLKLSNDAFFALYCDEEPIDEANLEEAQAIAAKFPNGFTIGDDWEMLGDTGLIEAEFIAERVRPPEYTHSLELFNGWELLTHINGQEVTYMFWHATKDVSQSETTLLSIVQGKQWLITKTKGQYPIFKSKKL